MPARSYCVFWNAMAEEPPGGIRVAIDVPDGWSETLTAAGAPKFTVPGISLPGPMVSATSCLGKDFATCVAPMIEAGSTSTDLPGGRVWTEQRGRHGGITARIFVPATAAGGVVMCMIVVPPDATDRLDELRRVAETLRVEGD